ncbi:hypothetical protein PG984_013913 [Apiospora sp. TS-2023a]
MGTYCYTFATDNHGATKITYEWEDHTWDVVYQPDTKNWACCNGTNCNDPLPGSKDLGEPFDAPRPRRPGSLLHGTPGGYVQQTIPPSSSSPSTEPAPTPTNSSLSAGSSAGIGIGAGLGIALVVVGVGFWLLRRRRREQPVPEQEKGAEQQQSECGEVPGAFTGSSRSYVSPQELEINNIRPRELQA